MGNKLSSTEVKVYELYKSGLRPRDISQRMGISINTVYKAISKARKLLGDSEKREGFNGGSVGFDIVLTISIPPNGPTPSPGVDLVHLIQRLEGAYLELLREVREVKKLMAARVVRESPKLVEEVVEEVPSFIRDNLWVDVIRSRRSK